MMRVGAGKIAGFAAALLDGPGQIGFDRRGGRIEIVAVEAKARFEAQRIARAEADGLDFRRARATLPRALSRARRAPESRSRLRRYSPSA